MTALPPAPDGGANPGTGPTPDQAAWIRAHAWTAAMRREALPASCACQYGTCGYCVHGRHDACINRQTWPKHRIAGYVCGRGGITPPCLAEPYEHETSASATGPQFTSLAQVWLADRVCRWVCPCSCHTAPPEPGPPLQLDLFGAAL